jgi:hypothetical protein
VLVSYKKTLNKLEKETCQKMSKFFVYDVLWEYLTEFNCIKVNKC